METLPIFVYGTLQRGEIRESCWPHPADRILWATVRGTLYDLGPHPALTAGETEVRGELWFVPTDGMTETLRVLDTIEGFAQPGKPDWYQRHVVLAQADDGNAYQAFAYYYARLDELNEATVVLPSEMGVCHWRS